MNEQQPVQSEKPSSQASSWKNKAYGAAGVLLLIAIFATTVVDIFSVRHRDLIPVFYPLLIFEMSIGLVLLFIGVGFRLSHSKKEQRKRIATYLIWVGSLYFLVVFLFYYNLRYSCCSSFTEDTLVVTRSDIIPIKDIKVGDYVLSYDTENRQEQYSRVLDVITHNATEVYVLNNSLQVTSEHPIALYKETSPQVIEWTLVRDLEPGQQLVTRTGEMVLNTVDKLNQSEPIPVYNLIIDEPNTYFVVLDEHKLLVHNKTI